jgi:antirestriction protein ArdC
MAKQATRRKAATESTAANDNKRTAKKTVRRSPIDVYQEVTDRILELLDAGTVPWHNPIRGAGGEVPKNLARMVPYRGVNVFLLAITAMVKGYESPYWITFKQAAERGGQVKKGEKATRVIFWKKLQPKDPRLDPNKRPGELSSDDLKEKFVLRQYAVFNAAAQCDGLDVPALVGLADVPAFVRLEEAERIIREYPDPPTIEHHGTQASYNRKLDRVRLPVPERFESREDYYATAYHELVHSTGHRDRCDRGLTDDPPPFGSPDYSKEELVAECGAAFLAAAAGIGQQTIVSSASYIDGWRKKLRGDKKLVVQAASQAQRAADHILGVRWDEAASEEAQDPVPDKAEPPCPTAAGAPLAATEGPRSGETPPGGTQGRRTVAGCV